MPGPKPGALPLGDAPSRYLIIIKYKDELSRTIFCKIKKENKVH